MYDYYTNFNCSNGSCPLLVEQEIYGVTTSTCEDYCGTSFGGCSTCYFEEKPTHVESVHITRGGII